MKRIIIALIIGMFLVSGCGEYSLSINEPGPQSSGLLAAMPGDVFDPSLPTGDRIFKPITGSIDCEYTGRASAYASPLKFGTKYDSSHNIIYYHYVDCPIYANSMGCEVVLENTECKSSMSGTDFKPYYRFGSSSNWVALTGAIQVGANKRTDIELACLGYFTNPSMRNIYSDFKLNPTRKWRLYDQPALRIDSQGLAHQGWIDGSWNCMLLSDVKEELQKMQNQGDTSLNNLPTLNGVERIYPGKTKNIIVGYDDYPLFGNVNPLGVQYNGKNIACHAFQGIYEVEKVYTYGGVTYYKQGTLLSSYSEKKLCCESSQCASGSYCENYVCTTKPTECKYGQCSPVTFVETKEQTEENENFYLSYKTCNSITKCVEIEKTEIACTDYYCQRMCPAGNDCYCDLEKGCQQIIVQEECGSGYCCKEGGKYKVQNCAYGMECCMEALSDPFKGECRDSCEDIVPKKEIECNDGKDNDNDGLIDDKDSDCQICIYKTTEGKTVSTTGISAKECCETYKGGYTKQTTENPPAWQFWKSSTSTTQCYKQGLSVPALIILIAGILILICMVFVPVLIPLMWPSIMMVAIGIIWLMIGYMVGIPL